MKTITIPNKFFNQKLFLNKFKSNSFDDFDLEILYNGFYTCNLDEAKMLFKVFDIKENFEDSVICFNTEWYPNQPKVSFYQNDNCKTFEVNNKYFQIENISNKKKHNEYIIYEVEPVAVEICMFSPKGTGKIKLSDKLERIDYQEI